ncbi:MAG: glycerol-3-phosphate acyltransferase [Lachnospiraceae bacterium]|nr:glycerol-3-phosphate acyltransferase [Lachnospiraceae bacterium]
MTARIISTVIGYIFGCILTAEIAAGIWAGKRASELGDTGNPGMANIMSSLGFVPGIITLLGDLLKCAAAAVISFLIFRDEGWIVTLYAGTGCTLGHDFPFWRVFRGGKGVATTSMAVTMYCWSWGLIANAIGMITVFITKYLCIGGPVIPLSFTAAMLCTGEYEAAALSGFLTILSLFSHFSAIKGIRDKTTKRTDVLKAISKKLSEKKEAQK